MDAVARAIYWAQRATPDEPGWDQLPEDQRERWLTAARAAVRAMADVTLDEVLRHVS